MERERGGVLISEQMKLAGIPSLVGSTLALLAHLKTNKACYCSSHQPPLKPAEASQPVSELDLERQRPNGDYGAVD